MTGPRAPRSPVKRGGKKQTKATSSEAQVLVDALIDEDVVLEFVPTPVELAEMYVCRKPFTLRGKRMKIGDLVPIADIPRPESWIRTGFIKANPVPGPVGQPVVKVAS